MNKADVCINHTTAVRYMSKNFMKMWKSLEYKPGKNSPIFDKLLSYLEPPTIDDSSLEYFEADNIQGHSTSMYSFIRDSKRYVWYNNPEGHRDEISDLDDSMGDIDFTDGSVEDLKRQGLDVPDGIARHLLFDFNAHRVLRYIRSVGDRRQYRSVMDKYRSWNKGVRSAGDQHHPMKLLYLLKILTNADHLEILHPTDTMPSEGPQTTDGIDKDVPNAGDQSADDRVGACSLWTCMYAAKVDEIIGGQLRAPRRDTESILRTIKESLNSKCLHGRVNKDVSRRSVLARGVDDFQFSIQAMLALVYDVIPEKDVVESYEVTTRKRKRNGVSMGWQGWHAVVFRKLDEMVQIIEGEFRKVHRTTYEVSSVEEGNILKKKLLSQIEDSIIAGYIETLAIVSGEDETNNGLTYLDKTAHIATFVSKNKMVWIWDLKEFVGATKFLIACKHNDDPENADIPRKTYAELTAPTRSTRGIHDKILRDTHSKLFKYSLADRQRDIENKKLL